MNPLPKTTDTSELRRRLVQATFDATADYFDDPALFFWDHCGTRTVDLAEVAVGDQVLDVCCGTGAASLPAAERVGVTGRVVGIDLAAGPLAKARNKAAQRGLTNVDFLCGDMNSLNLPDRSCDVVLCTLGLYFAVDLPAALAELWRVVRPGGTLAVATWGRQALEPANAMYLDAVGAERPDLRPSVTPWERINQPDSLAQVFYDAAATEPTITNETLIRPTSPDEFWKIVLGSGYRLLVEAIGAQSAERVRNALTRRMVREGVRELTAEFLYARAVKAK